MTTKRWWLRLHLSTVIVLTITASIFLYANLIPPRVVPESVKVYHPSPARRGQGMTCKYRNSGWPFSDGGAFSTPSLPEPGEDEVGSCQAHLEAFNQNQPFMHRFGDAEPMILNAVIGITLLLGVGLLLEYLIRCREARRRPLHFGSFLVLLAILGLLVGANFWPRTEVSYRKDGTIESQCRAFGWPLTCLREFSNPEEEGPHAVVFVAGEGWNNVFALLNVYTGLALAGIGCALVEYRLRRPQQEQGVGK